MLARPLNISRANATTTGACAGASNTIQLPYSIPLVQASSGSASADVTLSGEDDLCATLTLNFQITLFKLESLNATLQGGLHTSIILSDTVKGSFNASGQLPPLKGNPIIVLIGDVPIGFTPSITLFGGVNGQAQATISTGVVTDTTLTAGLSYANGVWSPIDTAVSPTVAASTTSADADTSITGTAGVTVGLNVSTVPIQTLGADVALSGEGYLQLNAGLNQNPCWTLDGGLQAYATLSATWLSETLKSYTTPTASIYTANIDHANGPCYTITVTPSPSTLDRDETVQLKASEVDILGNPISNPYNWTTSDPSIATVDSNGLVTGVSAGTATISATDPTTTAVGNGSINVDLIAPTYFLSGTWAGTATELDNGNGTSYNVGATITQTSTSFTATITALVAGVPLTDTLNGQINGNGISFIVTSSDTINEGGTVMGNISADGRQVTGTGWEGSTGTLTWNGTDTLTATVTTSDGSNWNGTATLNGQKLTGTASDQVGDSVSFTVTLQ